MARSTFYYHLKRIGLSDGYDCHSKEINRIYEENRGWYGYRRITLALRNKGILVNHKTVQKLMGRMHLKAKQKKVRYRSFKGEVGVVAPNVVDRNFRSDKPSENDNRRVPGNDKRH